MRRKSPPHTFGDFITPHPLRHAAAMLQQATDVELQRSSIAPRPLVGLLYELSLALGEPKSPARGAFVEGVSAQLLAELGNSLLRVIDGSVSAEKALALPKRSVGRRSNEWDYLWMVEYYMRQLEDPTTAPAIALEIGKRHNLLPDTVRKRASKHQAFILDQLDEVGDTAKLRAYLKKKSKRVK